MAQYDIGAERPPSTNVQAGRFSFQVPGQSRWTSRLPGMVTDAVDLYKTIADLRNASKLADAQADELTASATHKREQTVGLTADNLYNKDFRGAAGGGKGVWDEEQRRATLRFTPEKIQVQNHYDTMVEGGEYSPERLKQTRRAYNMEFRPLGVNRTREDALGEQAALAGWYQRDAQGNILINEVTGLPMPDILGFTNAKKFSEYTGKAEAENEYRQRPEDPFLGTVWDLQKDLKYTYGIDEAMIADTGDPMIAELDIQLRRHAMKTFNSSDSQGIHRRYFDVNDPQTRAFMITEEDYSDWHLIVQSYRDIQKLRRETMYRNMGVEGQAINDEIDKSRIGPLR